MLKNMSNLGSVLSAAEQKTITGGREALTGAFDCPDGQSACLCNFHLIGCMSSGACIEACEHHF